jgi:antitoxin (DNA-binding transcriptional repressor) of toxin-antitoxin stability system
MNEPISIHVAKTHLSRLIARTKAGEEIVIARGRKSVAKLAPIAPKAKCVFGALKGKVSIGPEFSNHCRLKSWTPGSKVRRISRPCACCSIPTCSFGSLPATWRSPTRRARRLPTRITRSSSARLLPGKSRASIDWADCPARPSSPPTSPVWARARALPSCRQKSAMDRQRARTRTGPRTGLSDIVDRTRTHLPGQPGLS